MDWKALAPIIGAIAPTAGSILGGFIPFPGGSFIGQKFGEIIAKQFGVEPTPTAVAGAVATAGNDLALAKINAATVEARDRIEGFVEYEKAVQETIRAGLKETGATMRIELLPENRHWFYTGWRPAIGWVFVIVALSFGLMLTFAGWLSAFRGNERPLIALNEAWPLFAAYFAPLCLMVGVFIGGRSAEKAIEKKAIVDAAKAGVVVEPPKKPLPSPPKPPPMPRPVDRNPRT